MHNLADYNKKNIKVDKNERWNPFDSGKTDKKAKSSGSASKDKSNSGQSSGSTSGNSSSSSAGTGAGSSSKSGNSSSSNSGSNSGQSSSNPSRIDPQDLNRYLADLNLTAMPSTPEELKKARNAAMRKAHPDQGGNSQDAAKVNEAYDKLKKMIKDNDV